MAGTIRVGVNGKKVTGQEFVKALEEVAPLLKDAKVTSGGHEIILGEDE